MLEPMVHWAASSGGVPPCHAWMLGDFTSIVWEVVTCLDCRATIMPDVAVQRGWLPGSRTHLPTFEAWLEA